MRQQVETYLNQQKRAGQDQSSVIVNAGTAVLAGYAEDRVAIIFCSHPTVVYTVSLNPNPVAGQGIQVPAAGLPISLSLGEHGGIVKGPWYVTTATPGTLHTYMESLNSAP